MLAKEKSVKEFVITVIGLHDIVIALVLGLMFSVQLITRLTGV